MEARRMSAGQPPEPCHPEGEEEEEEEENNSDEDDVDDVVCCCCSGSPRYNPPPEENVAVHDSNMEENIQKQRLPSE